MPVHMELSRIIISEINDQQVIYLKEVDGDRTFPILIGIFEATSIDRRVKQYHSPRPLTHDLLALVVEGLRAKVTRVTITGLREGTYFATLLLERGQEVLSIDARPSDSIAVALRAEAPLFINEELLQEPPEQPALRDDGDDEPGPPSEAPDSPMTEAQKAEQLRRFLENLDPEDFGKFSM